MTKNRIACLLLTISVALPTSALGQAAQPVARTESASSIFGALQYGLTKPEAADWQETMRKSGLTPWVGNEGWWRMKAPDGELRVYRLVGRDIQSMNLLYFPAKVAPIGEATLAWMYRTASGYVFDDGDQLELMFPTESTLDGAGRKDRSLLLSLTGGALIRQAVMIQWKK